MHLSRNPQLHPRKYAAALIGAGLLSLSLTACGDDSEADPSAVQTAQGGETFNDADVRFATEMVQHHAQAVEMVVLTQGRTLDPEVQQLADQIRGAQVPEIETMVDWLTAWDQEVPETSLDHANAEHDTGDEGGMETGDMPGMMSGEDMDALEEAPDAEFQELWLSMMVEHHTGAVEMARAEQADGESADAIDLAETIETSQEGEIETMEALLGA